MPVASRSAEPLLAVAVAGRRKRAAADTAAAEERCIAAAGDNQELHGSAAGTRPAGGLLRKIRRRVARSPDFPGHWIEGSCFPAWGIRQAHCRRRRPCGTCYQTYDRKSAETRPGSHTLSVAAGGHTAAVVNTAAEGTPEPDTAEAGHRRAAGDRHSPVAAVARKEKPPCMGKAARATNGAHHAKMVGRLSYP